MSAMATAMATVENDVDELCDATETLGVSRISYETMVAKEDANIRWNDLTNDAFAVLFVNKYFTTATGSKTLMYYVEEKVFYEFNGVYWKRLSATAQELMKKFPNDGSSDEQFLVYLWSSFKAVEKDMKDDDAKEIRKRIKGLEANSGRTAILQSLKTICAITDTIQWNRDRHLFVFEDVIVDLTTCLSIDAVPEQYINMSCGFKWVDDLHGYTEEEMAEARRFVKIFVFRLTENAEMSEFLMRIMSSFLYGKNVSEKAYFFLGQGRNGKGTLTALLQRAFGNYFGELQLEYFTTLPHSPDAPNGNLYGIANSRIINTSEVASSADKGEVWLDGPFKRLTGNDTITVRKPYSQTFHSFAAGNVIIQCNVMPQFKGTDQNVLALMQRTVIVDLPFSFVDDDAEIASNPSKYRKRDNTVKHRFETVSKYKYALLDVLFEYFRMHKEKFLTGTFLQNQGTPQKVRDSISNYFGQFDTTSGVNAWLTDNIEDAELGPGHKPLDVGTLFTGFIRDTASKLGKGAFVEKVKAALGERSTNATERATTRGVYRNGNSLLVQGFKLKEVLQPMALGDMFDNMGGGLLPPAPEASHSRGVEVEPAAEDVGM